MKCPRCKSDNKVTNGVIKGNQRFKCKDCNYNYIEEKQSGEYSIETKKKALQLYL